MTAWCMTMKRRNWSINEQAKLLKQIGELLARGYPIAEAIESISLHLPANRKEELYDCLIELRNGIAFHDVLGNLGFHKDLIGYVYFAEQHGSFAEALLEGSSLAMVKENDRKKLVKLLQYPCLANFYYGYAIFVCPKIIAAQIYKPLPINGIRSKFFYEGPLYF